MINAEMYKYLNVQGLFFKFLHSKLQSSYFSHINWCLLGLPLPHTFCVTVPSLSTSKH